MDKIEIRVAKPEESGLLSRLALSSKRHWGYDEELISLWRDDLIFSPEFIRTNPVYVGCQNGKIIAVYAFCTLAGVTELEHFWLAPEFIGLGVGQQMFQHLTKQLKIRGKRSLKIVSDPNAAGFYKRMGAKRIAVTPSKPAGRMLPVFEWSV